jgi:hypothetical protein
MSPFNKSFSKGGGGGDANGEMSYDAPVVENNDNLVDKRNNVHNDDDDDDDKPVQKKKKDEVLEWWASSIIMDPQECLRQHFHSNSARRVIPSYKVELEDPLVLDPVLPAIGVVVCPMDDKFLNEYDISDDDSNEQDTDDSFLLFLYGDHDNSEVVDSSDEEDNDEKERDSYYAVDSDDSESEYAEHDSFVSQYGPDESSLSSDQWSASSSSSSPSQPATLVEDFDDISVLTMDEFQFEFQFELFGNKAPQDAIEDHCLVKFLVELCHSSASVTSRKALYELTQARE